MGYTISDIAYIRYSLYHIGIKNALCEMEIAMKYGELVSCWTTKMCIFMTNSSATNKYATWKSWSWIECTKLLLEAIKCYLWKTLSDTNNVALGGTGVTFNIFSKELRTIVIFITSMVDIINITFIAPSGHDAPLTQFISILVKSTQAH